MMAVIDQSVVNGEQAWDPAPGVDIVMSMPDGVDDSVLDGRTLKLIGALHRRFWTRRRELLQRRAQEGRSAVLDGPEAHRSMLANLAGDEAATWDGRIDQLQNIVASMHNEIGDGVEALVAIRGWDTTETGVLVDGRAVPGCIFDLAAAMMIGADAFRRELSPFAIAAPAAADDEESKLWSDLVDLAHDRAGVDRGTVRIEAR